MMYRRPHPYLAATTILASLALIVFFANLVEDAFLPGKTPEWGVTFIPRYAEYLGSNPREVLPALLDDLGVRNFRLTVPWNDVEPERGKFTFGEIEWQLDEIKKRDGRAVVAIGRRTPRWPECHIPDWLSDLSTEEQEQELYQMLTAVVNRLKSRGEIVAWQVENEVFLSIFGECELHTPAVWHKEVALVRSLDPSRPLFTTESGELSTWLRTAPYVDGLGISIYRQTWDSTLGKVRYPFWPGFYRRRAEFTQAVTRTPVFGSELQGEPWAETALGDTPIEEQLRFLNADDFRRTIEFAKATRLSPMYIWGAEWWWHLKENGHPELWDAAREIFKK